MKSIIKKGFKCPKCGYRIAYYNRFNSHGVCAGCGHYEKQLELKSGDKNGFK